MAYLVVHTPNSPPLRVKLGGPTVVGRALGCELWIDDSKLSRRHCRIEQVGDEWFVEDLDSTNGTYVDGQRIKRHKLHDGTTFEAGRSQIVFREGEFVAHRPADPLEAATMGPGLLKPSLESSTMVGQRFTEARSVHPSTPTPASTQKSDQKSPAVPLPFARPPAQPKVQTPSRWKNMLNQLWKAVWRFGR